MRVANIYDIDNKTYLFKLAQTPEKAMLLIESGVRFHTTQYDWPKGGNPSGFAMKVRYSLATLQLCLAFGSRRDGLSCGHGVIGSSLCASNHYGFRGA